MTTENNLIRIVDGPRRYGMFVEALGEGKIVTFQLKFHSIAATLHVKTKIRYYTSQGGYIAGMFVNASNSDIGKKIGISDKTNIYFTGNYDIRTGKGELYLFLLQANDYDAHCEFNDNTKVILPAEIEFIVKFKHRIIQHPHSVGITDEQMMELKKIIIASEANSAFGKRALCWLLDKSENLSKPVGLTFDDQFHKQAQSAADSVHDMNSANGTTFIYKKLAEFNSNVKFSFHCGSYVNGKYDFLTNGYIVWLSPTNYDLSATIFTATTEIVKEIENYNLNAPARKYKTPDEKMRDLIDKILTNKLNLSPFCLRVLLWLIDKSNQFTTPTTLVFTEEFDNFGYEIAKAFTKEISWNNLFSEFLTDYTVSIFISDSINSKYSIRLIPPNSQENMVHFIKTIDAKLLNEIQGIPLN